MRLLFMASEKEREQDLAAAFCAGARRHRVDAEVRPLGSEPDLSTVDAVAMVGVKSKRLFDATKAARAIPIMLDKGYTRTRRDDSRVWEFWRVAVNAHHPTAGLMDKAMPPQRAADHGFEPAPWRSRGLQILIAGSSAKYHEFYDLPDPTEWAHDVVGMLKVLTDRPIIYRPKPSWDGAVPITGTYFSHGKQNIREPLTNAWAVVTHGSNTCFEAAMMGVPSIVLGEGVAAPISSRTLAEIDDPRRGKRRQWLDNLAFRQWTEREMKSGLAWEHIGGWVDDERNRIARGSV